MCSSYLVAATAKKKQDAQLLIWLQEEVVEPTVFDEVRKVFGISLESLLYFLEFKWSVFGRSFESLVKVKFLECVMNDLLLQAELGVYEELWDSARLLTEAEAKPLERMFGDKTPEDSLVHFLKVQSH